VGGLLPQTGTPLVGIGARSAAIRKNCNKKRPPDGGRSQN